jgi:hypothetical protein
MNDQRDNGFSDRGPAAGQPGPPESGLPRKPRIEVLQRSPAAAPEPGRAQSSTNTGMGAAGAAAPGAPPAQASWVAPNQTQHAGAVPAPRRSGLFRSRTSLLMLLAAIIIAGFLLYTYLSSERGAEYPDKGTEISPADAELLGNPQADTDTAVTEEPDEPPAAASTDDETAPEPEAAPEPTVSSAPDRAPPRAATPEAEPAAVAERAEAPPAARTEPADDTAGASDTVRGFYSALSAGDGRSAAQLVVPGKRQSGPLSAGALTRYYSSFRRPLRVRSVTPVDANTVRVAYDYVLADGRLCRGQAAVDVVQRDGRSLVSSIRTRGPC